MSETYSATGRRKTATARVTLVPGTGQITINKRPFEDYFGIDPVPEAPVPEERPN